MYVVDDDEATIRAAVQPILERVHEAELQRESIGEPFRGYSFGTHVGVGLVLQVPTGYEELTAPLAERFGSRLLIEVDDGWRGYAPLTDASDRRPTDTP